MKLEELVPDIELCKLIPQGEFEDSYAVYIQTTVERDNVVLGNRVTESSVETSPVTPRDRATAVVDFLEMEYKFIPAPTFEEIMKELGYFIVSCFDSGYSIEITTGWECASADSAVDGVMKLWLKTKGIKYGKVDIR